MKAITLHQPYASALASGLTRYDTRSWKIQYRGAIAIHAGKKPVDGEEFTTLTQRINTLCPRRFMSAASLPFGSVIAVAEIRDCIEITDDLIAGIDPVERILGDWQSGRHAWLITNMRRFEQPLEHRGLPGLWDWDSPEDLLTRPAVPQTDDAGTWLTPAQRMRYR